MEGKSFLTEDAEMLLTPQLVKQVIELLGDAGTKEDHYERMDSASEEAKLLYLHAVWLYYLPNQKDIKVETKKKTLERWGHSLREEVLRDENLVGIVKYGMLTRHYNEIIRLMLGIFDLASLLDSREIVTEMLETECLPVQEGTTNAPPANGSILLYFINPDRYEPILLVKQKKQIISHYKHEANLDDGSAMSLDEKLMAIRQYITYRDGRDHGFSFWSYREEWDPNSSDSEEPQQGDNEVNEPELTYGKSKYPLNQILYGPPGTGKTYHTLHHALAIIEGEDVNSLRELEHDELKAQFDKYREEKRIEIVTFHQNFAYEDFVEGIKPVLEDSDGDEIGYEIQPGIFHEISERARRNSMVKKSFDIDIEQLVQDYADSVFEDIEEKGEVKIGGQYSGRATLSMVNYKNDDFKSFSIGGLNMARYSQLTKSELCKRYYAKYMLEMPGGTRGLGGYYNHVCDMIKDFHDSEWAMLNNIEISESNEMQFSEGTQASELDNIGTLERGEEAVDQLIEDFAKHIHNQLENGKEVKITHRGKAILSEVIYKNGTFDALKIGGLTYSERIGKNKIKEIYQSDNRNFYKPGWHYALNIVKIIEDYRDNEWKRLGHEKPQFSDNHTSKHSTNKGSQNYVLIIDEINRGNIAKIFGELITLLEPSKREGEKDAMRVTLPYSKQEFSVPSNLYIIGTMNTADRSIALLDTALRRRFEFVEMMPDASLLKDCEGVNLKSLLEAINDRITVLLDREHQIGHSYLMGVEDMARLRKAFQNQIVPLLQEYFYDNWEKIKVVLNHNGFVREMSIKDQALLNSDLVDSDRKIYELQNDDYPGWDSPDRYRAIYESGAASGEQAEADTDEQ